MKESFKVDSKYLNSRKKLKGSLEKKEVGREEKGSLCSDMSSYNTLASGLASLGSAVFSSPHYIFKSCVKQLQVDCGKSYHTQK